jgi:hypothetical protein
MDGSSRCCCDSLDLNNETGIRTYYNQKDVDYNHNGCSENALSVFACPLLQIKIQI